MEPSVSKTSVPHRFRFASALRQRSFLTFYSAILSSDCGVEMQVIARGWLMYSITGSVFWLGVVTSALGFSSFAAAPIGGLLADRINKESLMIAGQCAMAIDMVFMGVSISTGVITPWLLIIGTGILGLSLGFASPARFSAVPQLVAPAILLNAVSLSSSTRNVTRIVAPVIAGYVIRAFGPDIAYYAIAGFNVSSALIMLGLPNLPPPDRPKNQPSGSPWRGVGEGFTSVMASATLSLLIGSAILSNGLGVPVNFLLPIFAEDVLHIGPQGLGFLTSTSGLGSIAGMAFLASLGNYQRKGVLLLAVIIGLGISIVAFSASTTFWLSLILLIPVGFTQTAQMVLTNTLLLANSPERVRGRVMSVFQMTGSSLSFTIVPMGAMASLVGAPFLVQVAGGLLALSGIILTTATPLLRRLR